MVLSVPVRSDRNWQKDFGTEEFKTYDQKIREDIQFLLANLADRYIADRHLPDKAIDLIDEAAAAAVAH